MNYVENMIESLRNGGNLIAGAERRAGERADTAELLVNMLARKIAERLTDDYQRRRKLGCLVQPDVLLDDYIKADQEARAAWEAYQHVIEERLV